jgi:hypothetical protein
VIRLLNSLLFFSFMFEVWGCGGRPADSIATETVIPNGSGGTASAGYPNTGNTANTNGGTLIGSTSSNTGGGTLAGGTSSSAGSGTLVGSTSSGGNGSPGGAAVQASGGHCSTNKGGLTQCSMHSGGSQSNYRTVSGDSVCTGPNDGTYVIGSNFAGYAFAFISLSENIDDTLSCAIERSDALCFSGLVAATHSSFVPVAAVGLNLNQSQVPDSPANPIPGKITSLTVDARNPGSGNLRIQVNQGTTYYCYDITGISGSITVYPEQFNTQCWDNCGTFWDGTDAMGVQLILVNPNESGGWSFDICLDSLSIQ